jgi:hypothetical protein
MVQKQTSLPFEESSVLFFKTLNDETISKQAPNQDCAAFVKQWVPYLLQHSVDEQAEEHFRFI